MVCPFRTVKISGEMLKIIQLVIHQQMYVAQFLICLLGHPLQYLNLSSSKGNPKKSCSITKWQKKYLIYYLDFQNFWSPVFLPAMYYMEEEGGGCAVWISGNDIIWAEVSGFALILQNKAIPSRGCIVLCIMCVLYNQHCSDCIIARFKGVNIQQTLIILS